MQFETKIPVKKHLKKFIAKEAGSDELRLGSSNMYGMLFSCFFTRQQPLSDGSELGKDQRWTHIRVNFTFDDLRRKGFTMSVESVMQFNKIVELQFRNQLLQQIQLRKGLMANFVLKDTILGFLDYYGIDEDEMKYDTIVKWVQRNG